MTTEQGRGAALVRGDALRLPLGDETVDLIVTSPPYFALRSYSDGGEHYDGQIGSEPTPRAFLEALWAVTAECWRVLKPTGSLFVNLGDKYAGTGGGNGQTGLGGAKPTGPTDNRSMPTNNTRQTTGFVRDKSLMMLPARYAIGCTDGRADPEGVGWVLRQDLVWSKPNGMPESVKDRCRRAHEFVYHLTKEGRYCADMDEVREEYAPSSLAKYETGGLVSSVGTEYHPSKRDKMRLDGKEAEWRGNPKGKLPGSVWTIPTQPLSVPEWLDVDHFAAYPTELPRRAIAGWCPDDGVVLDPFGGTGTTAMVARALGRYGVSLDLSADYLRLATWRIWQSGQAAKVAAKTDGERQGVLL